MSDNSYNEMQITLDEAKKKVKLGEALARLEKNKDFKLVIEHEFLTQEPLRLVSLLSDHNMQAEHLQKAITMDLRAGSAMDGFFRLVKRNAEQAEQSALDTEEQMARMRDLDEE